MKDIVYKYGTFPNQQTSTKTKFKESWYKPSADYVTKVCTDGTNNGELTDLINAVHGIYSETTFNYVLKPYGNSANNYLKDMKMPGEIRDTSIIKDIVDKKLGRYIINRPMFQVKVNNTDVIFEYNKKFQKLVERYKNQLLVAAMEKEGINPGIGQLSEEALNQLKEQIRTFKDDYLDERAIKGQDILDAIWDWTDSEMKYWTAYWDWIVTGRCFMDREITNGTLYKEVVRPDEFFYVDNGADFADDFDMHYIRKKISYPKIIEKYGHRISDKDLLYLKSMMYSEGESAAVSVPINTVQDRYGYIRPDIEGAAAGSIDGNLNFTDGAGNVDIYYIRWKTEKPVYIVTFVDELGQVDERREDEDYVLNEAAGDIDMVKIYIEQFIEVIRFGDDVSGVYLKPKYSDVQRTEFNNNSTCKSTLVGKVGLFRLAPNPSIVKRLMPFDVLDKIYSYQIERIVSREVNNGRITILPQSLLSTDKISMDQNMYMLYADGKLIIDDSEANAAIAAQMLKTTDHGMGRIIGEMINLKKHNKEEAWDNVGWNRQIDGEIFASDGKANTNSAINIAAASAVLADETFYKFQEKDLTCDLDISKIWFIERQIGEGIGSFRDSDGNVKMLELSGEDHASSEYGLFVVTNAREREKYADYKALAFNASQQGDYEIGMAAIDASSSKQIQKSLKDFRKLTRQAEERQAQLDRDTQERIKQMEVADKQAERDLVTYEIDANNEAKIEVAMIQAEAKLLDSELGNTSKADVDNMRDASAVRSQERKLRLEERKQAHAEHIAKTKDKLERDKMKSAEKIAAKNKN